MMAMTMAMTESDVRCFGVAELAPAMILAIVLALTPVEPLAASGDDLARVVLDTAGTSMPVYDMGKSLGKPHGPQRPQGLQGQITPKDANSTPSATVYY
jgi:hypothetical protein